MNKREQVVAVFRHDDFAVEIYSVLRWVKVEHEGDREDFFEEDESNENPNVAAEEELPEEGDIIPQSVFDSSGVSEDIAMVIGQGFQVDDDNEPAEENVPTPTVDDSTNSNYVEAEWNWNGMCPRKMNGCRNMMPCLKGVEETMIENISLLMMFLLMIPKKYFEEVILVETNKVINGEKLTFGEFLRWIGIWFFLSTLSGFSRSDFWSSKEIRNDCGAPYRVNCWMSGRRFNDILVALKYTKLQPPPYKDKFWEVRELLRAWKDNMTKIFSPSYICCLDESMSIWYNR